VDRQIDVLENGGRIKQETLLYDAEENTTRPMRSKEEANDYRYFPDPDLLPVEILDEFIAQVRATMPELPQAKLQRFQQQHQLSAGEAYSLVSNKETAFYFEATVDCSKAPAQLIAHWINGDFSAALNKHQIDINDSPISPKQLANLLDRLHDQTISGKIAKTVFEAMWQGEGDADSIISSKGLKQMTDSSAIASIIDDIIAANPKQVEQYKSGKDKVFGFFVGQVMKATEGKANPQQVNDILKNKLGEPI